MMSERECERGGCVELGGARRLEESSIMQPGRPVTNAKPNTIVTDATHTQDTREYSCLLPLVGITVP